MNKRKPLYESLAAADSKAQYDDYVKIILSNKGVLARVLQKTVEEYQKFTVEQIMQCIDSQIEMSCVNVHPGYGGKEAAVKLLLNIEAQKSFYRKYSLTARGIFYGARMISAQLDTEFADSDYNNIKKVYQMKLENALEKAVNEMCNLSEAIEERGISKGISRVVSVLVKTCKEFGMSKETTSKKVKTELSLSQKKAAEYVNKYW